MSPPVPICPCGDPGPMTRFGFSSTAYRDLVGGKAVEVRERLQRYACKACGRTTVARPCGILTRFRMTERLADAVAEACVPGTYASVGAAFGIDKGTVRDVFAERSAGLLAEADASRPAVLGVCVVQERHIGLLTVHDLDDGRLANAFEGEADPRLPAYLSGCEGPVHVDQRIARVLEGMPGAAGACIHRMSAVESLVRLMPYCVRRLMREWRGGADKPSRETARLLGRERYRLRPAEAGLLREASARWPLVSLFMDMRDRALAIFATPDPHEARAAVAAWTAGLSGRMADAFAPVREWLAKWGEMVLAPGYGMVPCAAWTRARSHRITVLRMDTPLRAVVRALSESMHGPAPDLVPAMDRNRHLAR